VNLDRQRRVTLAAHSLSTARARPCRSRLGRQARRAEGAPLRSRSESGRISRGFRSRDHGLRPERASNGPADLRALQEEPLASTTASLQDLGTYPVHAIVDMFTFDITTHVRYDIVKPRGPIQANLRRLDERQLGPAVSWLLAGIPRMQRKLPREFAGPLGLDLTGPAGTGVTISSDGAAITVTPSADSAFEPRAVITSSTDDFLAWSTTRLPWQQLVSVDGDRDEAARFLNALNLV
jgi:hypothetical protein